MSSSLTDIFSGVPSSAPWSEIPNLGSILGGGSTGGLGSILGGIFGGGSTGSSPGSSGINAQALSGPLDVSDFWRMIIALMIFVLIADSVPGDAGIWWGLLSLMAMAAIYYTNTDSLISGIKNYLSGQAYQA